MSPHAISTPDSLLSSSPVSTGSPLTDSTPELARTAPSHSIHQADQSLLTSDGPDDEPYDLVGVGFGPANLALAIALQDALEARRPLPGLSHIRNRKPRVLFLEKQSRFGWHEGMLLPGTRMQISFVKDLATLRDPRSHFTFLNYLQHQKRLVQFTNLDTFLPQRIEYQDYMKWCASHFANVVAYGSEVRSVVPVKSMARHSEPIVSSFQVGFDNLASGQHQTVRARHIVVAAGGKPRIPQSMPQSHPRVLHSSQYANRIHQALPDPSAAYRVAVVGAGQSAAEVFNDLHSRYPRATTRLFIRGDALKPSDDSPFVNELFDPDRVDKFFARPETERHAALMADKATNYGVVRLTLLEHLYNTMYTQRLSDPDETQWQHRIINYTSVEGAEPLSNSKGLRLLTRSTLASGSQGAETADFDAVIIAAGYLRNIHETILEPCWNLMPEKAAEMKRCTVGRDYRVQFGPGKVSPDAGVWLQGCNEQTHGLSDTLLSILAVRGGEMTQNLFADDVYA